mmetsp:Transcript_15036/g.50456  ORF Transcript_15036/g.50456 Transcript_15036/m.50456 type:complete len:282 (-) Transcript_15036:3-848(-)
MGLQHLLRVRKSCGVRPRPRPPAVRAAAGLGVQGQKRDEDSGLVARRQVARRLESGAAQPKGPGRSPDLGRGAARRPLSPRPTSAPRRPLRRVWQEVGGWKAFFQGENCGSTHPSQKAKRRRPLFEILETTPRVGRGAAAPAAKRFFGGGVDAHGPPIGPSIALEPARRRAAETALRDAEAAVAAAFDGRGNIGGRRGDFGWHGIVEEGAATGRGPHRHFEARRPQVAGERAPLHLASNWSIKRRARRRGALLCTDTSRGSVRRGARGRAEADAAAPGAAG